MRLWGSAPPAELALGQEVRLRNGGTGIVGRKLGAGGQGAVYLCDVGGRQLALKWYHPEVAAGDATLRARIERLCAEGAPDKRFLFPVDLVTIAGRAEFGYVMPVVSPDRRPLEDLRAAPPKRLELSLEVRATACYEIAEAFQALHTRGLCYQDVNFGSFFIDPIRGGILICDPDNITVEGQQGGVWGSPKFMAPEIVRRDTIPSSRTDLHSMAVLFFYTLFHWHPLEGTRATSPEARTEEGRRTLFGEDPVFIFDPGSVNGPPEGEFGRWLLARWNAMPAALRELFTRAFSHGLWNPDERVVETEWRSALARLLDAITECPACGFEMPLDALAETASPPGCPSCGAAARRPTRMALGRTYLVSMVPARQIFAHHVDAGPVTLRDSVATVDVHPTDPTIVGLRNLTKAPWQGRTGDGRPVTVMPERTVRIIPGLGIDFGRREGLVTGADVATRSAA